MHTAINNYFKTLSIGDSFIKEKMESFIMDVRGVINLKTNSIMQDKQSVSSIKGFDKGIFTYDYQNSNIAIEDTEL